eukprot:7390250-Prymnesium_polylepis.2
MVDSEAEVLLFPGTKLEVLGVANIAPGLFQVHLKEVVVPVQLINFNLHGSKGAHRAASAARGRHHARQFVWLRRHASMLIPTSTVV